jgi:outer membrane protein OmpA-like peptidoglycan-associated protein
MTAKVSAQSGGDTQLIRIHVKGVVLEGTCASGSIVPKLKASKGFNAPSWEALKRIFSTRGIAQDSDFVSIKKGVSVSSGASAGLGYIAYQGKFASWMRPAPPAGSGWKEGGDARTIDACFDRDSSDFSKKQANGWDVRFLLETILATDLALFNGVPNVDVEGFASPEYTPQHNLILSKKRANAVLQAILDAVGPLDSDAASADGHGDASAVAAGLQEPDPTGDEEERTKFEQEHQEQVAQWPQWRKVTINIRGHFSVHVVTVADEAG